MPLTKHRPEIIEKGEIGVEVQAVAQENQVGELAIEETQADARETAVGLGQKLSAEQVNRHRVACLEKNRAGFVADGAEVSGEGTTGGDHVPGGEVPRVGKGGFITDKYVAENCVVVGYRCGMQAAETAKNGKQAYDHLER